MSINDTATLRKKLQRWEKRLARATYPEFHPTLKQFWHFLQENPVLAPIGYQLEERKPPHPYQNWNSMLDMFFIKHFNEEPIFLTDEQDHAAFCYFVVMKCVEEVHANFPKEKLEMELEFARRYHPNPNRAELDWQYKHFVNNIIRPLIIHLTESLEENMVILTILQRYKHKCEWFQRAHLDKLWQDDSRNGEKNLKMHLYEYLYDNGVNVTIEPSSPIGEADLVTEGMIADAKLARDSGDRSAIIKGYHQVYKYTQDHQTTCGYLIVFNASDKDINITSYDGSQQESLYIAHNDKRIYISTVDICPEPVRASKRGPLRPAIVISKEDLISPEIK